MTSGGNTCAAVLFVLALAGCGASATPSASPSTIVTPTTSTASSPTPSYASENQVASVIAGADKTWREVDDESGKCRIGYVLKDDSGMMEIERMTCYTRELTAGIKAEIAIKELQALSVPPSMESLVDETTTALQLLVDADLENACGPAMSEPKDTKECDSAMGTSSLGYHRVTSVLDKWRPYL